MPSVAQSYLRGNDEILQYIADSLKNVHNITLSKYEAGLKAIGARPAAVAIIGTLSDNGRPKCINEAFTKCESDTGVLFVRAVSLLSGIADIPFWILRQQSNFTLQGLLAGEFTVHSCFKARLKEIEPECRCKKP